MTSIDVIEIADERDPNSPGMKLARNHEVNLAPFFIVEDNEGTRVYTTYFKFIKNELNKNVQSTEKDAEDILRDNRDLDFL